MAFTCSKKKEVAFTVYSREFPPMLDDEAAVPFCLVSQQGIPICSFLSRIATRHTRLLSVSFLLSFAASVRRFFDLVVVAKTITRTAWHGHTLDSRIVFFYHMTTLNQGRTQDKNVGGAEAKLPRHSFFIMDYNKCVNQHNGINQFHENIEYITRIIN